MPKISIIVPVYQTEKYLNRCVDSILCQTLEDFELILVDDGSKDRCPHICDEYAEKDHRIKVVHKENGGLSSARNVGIDISCGKYLTFVDSDDYIDNSMYNDMLILAEKNNADIVECGYRWIKPDFIRDDDNDGKITVYSPEEALRELYFGNQISGGISIVAWNKLYRRELFEGIRYAEGYIHEDVDATPRLLYKANKILKINRNYYNFFFSDNSITRSDFNIKKIDIVEMRRRISAFFGNTPLYDVAKYTESAYIDSLHSIYYECRIRSGKKYKDNDIYKQTAQKCRTEIKANEKTISDNPYTKTNSRYKLFRFSPSLFCLVKKIYKLRK